MNEKENRAFKRKLSLNLHKQWLAIVLLNWWKLHQIHSKILVPKSLFNMQSFTSNFIKKKKTPTQIFSYAFCKIFKNTIFMEPLRANATNLNLSIIHFENPIFLLVLRICLVKNLYSLEITPCNFWESY